MSESERSISEILELMKRHAAQAMEKINSEFSSGDIPPIKEDRTCLSWWYPKIRGIVPTPRTEIVTTDVELLNLIDGNLPDGWADFISEIEAAGKKIGGKVFLRTGHTSGKHQWSDCCGVEDDFGKNVANLVEFSAMAGMFGLPVKVWAVREYLQVEPLFRCEAYGGMPVVPERRYFVDGGTLLYSIPYWPPDALEQGKPDDPLWRDKLPIVRQEFNDEAGEMARKCGEACGGKWSVDVLLTRNGYYVTDMAEAEKSWGWSKPND